MGKEYFTYGIKKNDNKPSILLHIKYFRDMVTTKISYQLKEAQMGKEYFTYGNDNPPIFPHMQNTSQVWLPHKILYIVKEAQMGKDYFTYGKYTPCKTLRGMEYGQSKNMAFSVGSLYGKASMKVCSKQKKNYTWKQTRIDWEILGCKVYGNYCNSRKKNTSREFYKFGMLSWKKNK